MEAAAPEEKGSVDGGTEGYLDYYNVSEGLLGQAAAQLVAGDEEVDHHEEDALGGSLVRTRDIRSTTLVQIDHQAKLYEDAFESMAEDAEVITLSQFTRLCLDRLELNLSAIEVQRLWNHVADHDGTMNKRQFLQAIRKRRFLRRIAALYIPGTDDFHVVASDYDYSTSSNDNYQNPDTSDFEPEFAEFRAHVDYGYHVNYSRKRQRWQDRVIKSITTTEQQARPWIVFTCGPMGAGKGFALSWMSSEGYFPLENIVHIDPDHFKQAMPEWKGYVVRDAATAGTMCHRESGFMQELAQEVAMRNSQNIWVDGSLRDGDWFCKVFDDLRARHPHYQVAIFYVYTSEEVAWNRCNLRAIKTGRAVPRDLFLESLKSPDSVLRKLTPKVNFIARINNDGQCPRLEAFESVDRSGQFDLIRNHFGEDFLEPSPDRFPELWFPGYLNTSPDFVRDVVGALVESGLEGRFHQPSSHHTHRGTVSSWLQRHFSRPPPIEPPSLDLCVSLRPGLLHPALESPDAMIFKKVLSRAVNGRRLSPPPPPTRNAFGMPSRSGSSQGKKAHRVEPSAPLSPVVTPKTSSGTGALPDPEESGEQAPAEGFRRGRSGHSHLPLSTVILSPGFVLNMSSSARESAGVPKAAYSARHLLPHPDTRTLLKKPADEEDLPGIRLLMHGGFIWFDFSGAVIGVSEFSKVPEDTSGYLRCGWERRDLPASALADLQGRWVTCQGLAWPGSAACAWVLPGEEIGGERVAQFGGFAFAVHGNPAWINGHGTAADDEEQAAEAAQSSSPIGDHGQELSSPPQIVLFPAFL